MSDVTAVPLRPIAKGSLVRLWLGIGLVVVLAIGAAFWSTQAQVAMAQPPAEFLAANGKHSGVVTTPSGLEYEVLKPGTGPLATTADVALVNYTGKLVDGSTFDSNAAAGSPAPLPVGQMIPGFTEGLQHMNRGAKFRFWIPPELAYGSEDKADPRTGKVVIPANSVLIFDVEVVELAPMPAAAPGPGGGLPR